MSRFANLKEKLKTGVFPLTIGAVQFAGNLIKELDSIVDDLDELKESVKALRESKDSAPAAKAKAKK